MRHSYAFLALDLASAAVEAEARLPSLLPVPGMPRGDGLFVFLGLAAPVEPPLIGPAPAAVGT